MPGRGQRRPRWGREGGERVDEGRVTARLESSRGRRCYSRVPGDRDEAMAILLGYGARPLLLEPSPASGSARSRRPRRSRSATSRAALDDALAHPVGARPLAQIASSRTRVVVVVSGAAREEPRAELFLAVRRALARRAGRSPHARDRERHAPARRRSSGSGCPRTRCAVTGSWTTTRATRRRRWTWAARAAGRALRVNRCVAEADLVVTTGAVRPHHAAGWGGGAKGIFPASASTRTSGGTARSRTTPPPRSARRTATPAARTSRRRCGGSAATPTS